MYRRRNVREDTQDDRRRILQPLPVTEEQYTRRTRGRAVSKIARSGFKNPAIAKVLIKEKRTNCQNNKAARRNAYFKSLMTGTKSRTNKRRKHRC
jgi:hypothetical protein